MSKIFGLVGAGGFGREVISYLDSVDPKSIYFIDDNITLSSVNEIKVISSEEFLKLPVKKKYFNISIAEGQTRKKLAQYLSHNKIIPQTIKARNSIVHEYSDIDEGAILCDFTIISPNTKIGKFFHLNRFSQIGHDSVIGDYVTFAPQVNCNGNVIVKNNVYIGTGAIIRNGTKENPIEIGEGAIVGMGAVVTKNVKANSTVIGNPAKELKK